MKIAVPAGLCGVVLLLLAATACGSSEHQRSKPRVDMRLVGGTLRVVSEPLGATAYWLPGAAQYALDPQFEYFQDGAFELFRCCLLRTLLSLPEGGTALRPDLASSLPNVSPDELTWTFHLKRGLHYAPPYQRTEITAPDVVRALEREFRLGKLAGYPFYYDDIRGTRAFAQKSANSISGLEVPDPYTLVVHLRKPGGDLGYRFALPATAPIPPGADRGHDRGYGRYLVSSGPYMIAGSARMNFHLPPNRQRGATGWSFHWTVRHGRPVLTRPESLLLVRNPSWSRASDALRPAYPDRIRVSMTTGAKLSRGIERGAADVLLIGEPTVGQLRHYRSTPSLSRRVHAEPLSAVYYVGINTAEPPFDDVHVRRALNFAVDRRALVSDENTKSYLGGASFAAIATHALPDDVENDLLSTYDPYRGRRGPDVAAARAEMARSRYDRDRDGRCDAPACSHVVVLGEATDTASALRGQDRLIARAARSVGIHLAIRSVSFQQGTRLLLTPRTHLALFLDGGWLIDFPDGAGFVQVFENPTNYLNDDFALLGATRRELRGWGYAASAVPSVDAEIQRCAVTLGQARPACWAMLDQRLMESVVPWVPWGRSIDVHFVSLRVKNWRYDRLGSGPALDALAVKVG